MTGIEGHFLSREKLEQLIRQTEKARDCYTLPEMKDEIRIALTMMYGIRHDYLNFNRYGCD